MPRRHALLCRERLLRGHASTSPACPARAAPRPLLRCTSLSLAIVTAHAYRLGLGPRLRRPCLGVGVRLLLRVWDTRSPVSRGQQEAAAQEIEARPAKHLALEHFETIDVPFHGTRTPG